MGLNTDISEVIMQIDKIITSQDGRWLDVSDYNLKSKDRKNMKSVYGLIHDILHHVDNDQRIIDRIHKKNLEYLYKKTDEHVKGLG
ncbi:hypothetical protein N9I76_01070 [Candidatus Thioglobus sp.]|nr:hypothetical protein [Candidatus Thioglobus sp.]MDA8872090.1 hypothetical protein [Candidatus Thioglobus sp.]|tara:strand:- start:322 stop:579 length:258 start_codon:yes stop_codon:yes gene_type:complete